MDSQEIEDLNALREYNKNLLDLLRQTQTLLKGNLSEHEKRQNPNTHHDDMTANIEILGVSKPRTSKGVREKLSSHSKIEKVNNQRLEDSHKYKKYTEVTNDAIDRNQGKSIVRDIMTENFEEDLQKELNGKVSDARSSFDSDQIQTSTPRDMTRMARENRLLQDTKPRSTSYKGSSAVFTPPGTPKSILKRRQIIDDNVKVSAKYPHTPTNKLTPKHKGLNYSYSNADDDYAVNRKSEERSRKKYSEALNGSFTEEFNTKQKEIRRANKDSVRKAEKEIAKSLLLDEGNDRQNVAIIRDLASRPKAVLFDVDAPQPADDIMDSYITNSVLSKGTSSLLHNAGSSAHSAGEGRQPLLGYDWIAGVIDNESKSLNLPDDYFSDLNEFRRIYKADCISNEMQQGISSTRAISPEVSDPKHTCIHGYSVNERLFTEAMNVDEEGRSLCPICLIDRKKPTPLSPGFVRVSIPRATVAAPYRVIPHRRNSFDPSDTCSLANHCLAGWQSAKPSAIPSASTVDLKQGIKEKEILSYEDVQKMAASVGRLGRLLDSSATGGAAAKTTKDLLNTTHSLRAELQQLDKLRTMDSMHSSANYPML